MEVASHPHESKIYSEFSHFYEWIFKGFFFPRIKSTIESLNIPPGSKVLEVGVGTGLSLTAYPEHAEVMGIDLAPDMLEHAHEKVNRNGWRHISLRQMDALNLEFQDEQFDYVMAFHIVTVVPDYKRLMQEIVRVCKPGGTIVVINHFRSERRWIAPFVDLIDPITRHLGWSTRLRFEDLIDGVPLKVERRFKTAFRSFFTVMIARKDGEPLSTESAPVAAVSAEN